jgi:hypothetical protein
MAPATIRRLSGVPSPFRTPPNRTPGADIGSWLWELALGADFGGKFLTTRGIFFSRERLFDNYAAILANEIAEGY